MRPPCAYDALDGVAATLYLDDGTVLYPNTGILIEQNSANRFGGGVYVGIYDNGILQHGCPRYASAQVDLSMAIVRSNSVLSKISDAGFLASPSQIATENVQSIPVPPVPPCRPVPAAGLGFNVTMIQGAVAATDIGIYQTNSVPITGGSPACVTPTLYKCILSQ